MYESEKMRKSHYFLEEELKAISESDCRNCPYVEIVDYGETTFCLCQAPEGVECGTPLS